AVRRGGAGRCAATLESADDTFDTADSATADRARAPRSAAPTARRSTPRGPLWVGGRDHRDAGDDERAVRGSPIARQSGPCRRVRRPPIRCFKPDSAFLRQVLVRFPALRWRAALYPPLRWRLARRYTPCRVAPSR